MEAASNPCHIYDNEHPEYEYSYDHITHSISLRPAKIRIAARGEFEPDPKFAVSRQQLDGILNAGASMEGVTS